LHFRGSSRTGKTTALRVGGSVWGGGGVNGYTRTWRATDNGLEATAAAHCDTLLCLDEMGQVDGHKVGEIAYMLANGSGKSRATQTGAGRRPAEWRLLFLSTGELSLADKMMEAGKVARAGQEVRLVDIPADAEEGFGLFEYLHEFDSAEELARHLGEAANRYYGVAIQAFLERLVLIDRKELAETLTAAREKFLHSFVPAEADGQVRSVANRFALIAAAGTLATALEILPWDNDEAHDAAGRCFQDWLANRGGIGASEAEKGVKQVRQFLETHGASRFQPLNHDDGSGLNRQDEPRINQRVGYVEHINGPQCYLVFTEAFKSEVCRGIDALLVAKELNRRGHLKTDTGRLQLSRRLDGHSGTTRVYCIKATIFDDEEAADGGV